MGARNKNPDEVIAALLWHFTPYSVQIVGGCKASRTKTIKPAQNDELITKYLDHPRLRRRRLEWSEMMDIMVLKSRGLTDREVQSQLSFSTHNHGSLEELCTRINEEGYSIPDKDRDSYGVT